MRLIVQVFGNSLNYKMRSQFVPPVMKFGFPKFVSNFTVGVLLGLRLEAEILVSSTHLLF
jgi:hypothetical protein